jgi:hypothetical protein
MIFQEATPDRMDDDGGGRRPGVGVVLVMLMLLGLFANAAFFRVASDAARWIPDRAMQSPLRGGSGPDGLSTDTPSTARVVFRPQRGALSPIGSFRAPGWKPLSRAMRSSGEARCSNEHGDPA